MTSKNNPTVKWILPPELKLHFDRFVKLYDTVFKKPDAHRPLIIHGPPGVGKSLFAYAFEINYRNNYQGTLCEDDVKRVNISALAEDIIESELFGHVEGAFTGAMKDKKGFVEDTKLLILEEIGELSKRTQAKLLTYIEDGIYYRVGDTKPRKAPDDIQIITTTNVPLDDTHFRQDFLDRCYSFRVPALHERRGDILYILAHQYPDFFRTLGPGELFLVLCYNWPGNMREIEKFGVMRGARYCKKNFLSMASLEDGVNPDDMSRLEKLLTLLGGMDLYDHKEDKDAIEAFFLRGRLSINTSRDYPLNGECPPSKKIAFPDVNLTLNIMNDFPSIATISPATKLDQTKYYFSFFPMLLHVMNTANVDLYDIDAVFAHPEFYYEPYDYDINWILSNNLPSAKKYAETLKRWLKKVDDHGISRYFKIADEGFTEQPDYCAMTESDLLKSYYGELLSRTSNNVAEVARRSGVIRKTLDNRLIGLGVHPTRNK
jgi:DNA-binding NtrC family response regulator